MAKKAPKDQTEHYLPRFGSILEFVWFYMMYWMTYTFLGCIYPYRTLGDRRLLKRNDALLIGNHQSSLDPFAIGLWYFGRMRFLARDSLFAIPFLGFCIKCVGCVPLNREGSGKGGLTLARMCMKDGQPIAIYAEGTRSRDGELQPFKPGVALLIRQAKGPIILAAIAGAYECWPRQQLFPKPGLIVINFRRWEPPNTKDKRTLMSTLESDFEKLFEETRAKREKMIWGPIRRLKPLQASATPSG